MNSLLLILALKLASLVGAALNTLGFLTFFFWPSIAPYRWYLIIGGIALIAISELASKRVARSAEQGQPLDSRP
jgi:hypothetical protein